MKVVRLYEGSEVRVEEAAEPEAGPGQIRVAVQASCALPLPDAIAFEHGAILADAVATAYHAVALALLPGAPS